jgi:hypothetical protein
MLHVTYRVPKAYSAPIQRLVLPPKARLTAVECQCDIVGSAREQHEAQVFDSSISNPRYLDSLKTTASKEETLEEHRGLTFGRWADAQWTAW